MVNLAKKKVLKETVEVKGLVSIYHIASLILLLISLG